MRNVATATAKFFHVSSRWSFCLSHSVVKIELFTLVDFRKLMKWHLAGYLWYQVCNLMRI